MAVRMVRVRLLKESLQKTYGSYMHTTLEKGIQGQRKGYWEIIERSDGNAEPFQSAKDILSDMHSDGYMTKSGFRKVSKQALSYKDLFGEGKISKR